MDPHLGFSQVDSVGLQQNHHILSLRFLAGSGRMSRERNARIMRLRTLRSEKLSGSQGEGYPGLLSSLFYLGTGRGSQQVGNHTGC